MSGGLADWQAPHRTPASFQDCRAPKKSQPCFVCGDHSHPGRNCTENVCFNCHAPGHRRAECPRPEVKRWHRCDRCQLQGHKTWSCTDLWRRYHSVVPGVEPAQAAKAYDYQGAVNCYNCGATGHLGVYCSFTRANHMAAATYPLVVDYDWHRTGKWRRPELLEIVKKLARRVSKSGGTSRGQEREPRAPSLDRHKAVNAHFGITDGTESKGVPHTSTRLKHEKRDARAARASADVTSPPAASTAGVELAASALSADFFLDTAAEVPGAPSTPAPAPEFIPLSAQGSGQKIKGAAAKNKFPPGSRRALRAEKRAAENETRKAAKKQARLAKEEKRRLSSGLIVG